MDQQQPVIQFDVNDFQDLIEDSTADADTATEDSSAEDTTEQTDDGTTAETEAKADAESETETGDDDSTANEGDVESEVGDTDDQSPKKGAEARKAELSEEIRTLVSRRNELRAQIEQATAQAYQPQSADELIAEGVDPALARVEAMEQNQRIRDYNAQVAEATASLNTESLQVLADFPVFDPKSEAYNANLAKRAGELYQRVSGIQTDPNTGMVTNVATLPYEFYKAFAETAAQSVQSGQVAGQRAAEKMLAAVDTPTSAAPKPKKEDPFFTGLSKGYK